MGTILNGLMSFMYENQMTTGSITTSRADKRRLASCSLEFNLRNPTFRKLFPDVIEEAQQRQAEAEQVRKPTLLSQWDCWMIYILPGAP